MEKTVTNRDRSRKRKVFQFLVFVLALIPVNACESGKPSLRIDSPKAMFSPMFTGTASVFMEIENAGKASDTLVGVGTDVPGAIAELHDVKDGRMVKTDAIRIPAGGNVQLRPGGLHIMIFKLPATINRGANINLVLQFQQSGERKVTVQLTENATIGGNGHGH